MRTYLILTIFTFFLIPEIQAQDFYSVIAENGLIVRAKPNVKSERIGKFYCGEPVELIQKTNIKIEINDDGRKVEGNWYLVVSKSREMSELKGYVFSGFLLKNNDAWNIGWGCNTDKIVCSAEFSTKNTDVTIYNFQLDGNEVENKKKDTLVLYEAVFNEVGDKLLKIKPKKKYKKIEVYATVIETLNDWGETKNEDGIVPKWNGSKPYTKLEATNNFYYRVPIIKYDKIREATAKKLNLERAPNWDEVGEGWWVPRYKYKGLIVPYEIKSVLFKIITTDLNNKVAIDYVEIVLSYGC